jgi:hypothetical protein
MVRKAVLFKSAWSPLGILWLFCLFFIGADRLSFDILGVTIRFVAFPILILWAYLMAFGKENGFSKIYLKSTFIFVLGAAGSSVFSKYLPISVTYFTWLIFSVFIIGHIFFIFGANNSLDRVLSIWLKVYRVQVLYIFCELVYRKMTGDLGNWNGRPYIWFFEPSYAAIYFSGYFGISLYLNYVPKLVRQKKHRLDLILSISVILCLGTATGLMSVIFGTILLFVQRNGFLKSLIASLLVLYILYISRILLPDIQLGSNIELMFGFLSSIIQNPDNTFNIILDRSGSRMLRLLWAYQAFIDNFWLGVGIGADKIYMNPAIIPDLVIQYLHEYNNPVGAGFVNPFLEVGATMGIIGFIGLLILLARFVYFQSSLNEETRDSSTAKAILFGFFVMYFSMQLEGTFLRFYIWSYIGFAIGCYKNIKYNDKKLML